MECVTKFDPIYNIDPLASNNEFIEEAVPDLVIEQNIFPSWHLPAQS